jgi:tyrosine-protein kinase Etk/Wzc
MLASPRFDSLLNRLRERASFILLDSPPILAFADGLTLAALAGAAVLAVRSGTVTRREAQQAVSRLRDIGVNVLGVALNDVAPQHYHQYYRQSQRNGHRQIQ